jgi:uncharacterized membrane protein
MSTSETTGPRAADMPAPLFDANLAPHRSLGPRGFLVVMIGVSAISFTASIVFLLKGAWPVFGFFGLDVLLVYLAFRASHRSARLYETVRLTRDTLEVRRVTPSGRQTEWRFQPNWLRVEMDDPPEHDSELVLTSHGQRGAIGAFLTAEERLDFAKSRRDALALWRGRPA